MSGSMYDATTKTYCRTIMLRIEDNNIDFLECPTPRIFFTMKGISSATVKTNFVLDTKNHTYELYAKLNYGIEDCLQ